MNLRKWLAVVTEQVRTTGIGLAVCHSPLAIGKRLQWQADAVQNALLHGFASQVIPEVHFPANRVNCSLKNQRNNQ
jgi:hypothetical protein